MRQQTCKACNCTQLFYTHESAIRRGEEDYLYNSHINIGTTYEPLTG